MKINLPPSGSAGFQTISLAVSLSYWLMCKGVHKRYQALIIFALLPWPDHSTLSLLNRFILLTTIMSTSTFNICSRDVGFEEYIPEDQMPYYKLWCIHFQDPTDSHEHRKACKGSKLNGGIVPRPQQAGDPFSKSYSSWTGPFAI